MSNEQVPTGPEMDEEEATRYELRITASGVVDQGTAEPEGEEL